jgi:probable F420-dependent oxidoreductase
MKTMKFGTFLYQTSPNSIASVARKAEESGFESLWIPEHIILPVTYRSPYPYSSSGKMGAPPETPLHDPLLALAYVAGVTSKIRLATGVFVLPIRNAFTTAKAVASLDVLSGGRFIFGVGIGWLEEEFEGVGMNFKDRALRTREYLALMKELWTQDLPKYHGKTIGVEGFKMMPKPAQKPHPPIVFGGNTEPSLKRAAKLGDGWYGIAEGNDQLATTIKRLRDHERATEPYNAARVDGEQAARAIETRGYREVRRDGRVASDRRAGCYHAGSSRVDGEVQRRGDREAMIAMSQFAWKSSKLAPEDS